MIQIAAIQMSSQDKIEQNLADAYALLQQVAALGSSLAVLPENFACFAAGQQQQTAAQFELIAAQLAEWACQLGLWIIAGSLPCPYRPNGQMIPDGRVRSSCLLFDPSGQIVARYDKIHLFDVNVADGTGGYQESRHFEAGNQIVTAQTPFGMLGLMICYDLRFPELALALRQHGAQILTAPSAFTYMTGQQHWSLLLRARAIDSQCWVIGANQVGWHGTRQTWGNSSIIDYMGQICAADHTGASTVITACYDQTHLIAQRSAMPLMEHRRLDLPTTILTKDVRYG
ncbi:MAG: carbon-nitrogen hydrolase family protein [Pseudomonadota bacterium]|nr:carbon-nitrogen hydrolase family protein [Pseudomonadota bacterium]